MTLDDGWHNAEDWGIWSAARIATLDVDLAGSTVTALRIRGRYLDDVSRTHVWAEGTDYGVRDLRDTTLPLPGELASRRITLRFEHLGPLDSPRRRGLATDDRLLGGGLESIALIPAGH